MTVWPNGSTSKPYVSSAFGPRRAPIAGASTYHRGTDFSHTFGIIRAVASGQVKVAGTPPGWSGGGIQVWVQHDGFFSKSLHASSVLVKVGQWVREGDPLCIMGRTGTATDTHLHFELTPGNVHYSNTGQVDPVSFIANRISAPASGGASNPGEWDEMATKQEVADAVVTALTTYGAGPGNRNVFDSLKYLADITAQRATKQDAADGVVQALTTYGAGPGGRNVFDSLKFLAGLAAEVGAAPALTEAQVKVIADAVAKQIGGAVKLDYVAIAKAVNDDAAKRLSS